MANDPPAGDVEQVLAVVREALGAAPADVLAGPSRLAGGVFSRAYAVTLAPPDGAKDVVGAGPATGGVTPLGSAAASGGPVGARTPAGPSGAREYVVRLSAYPHAADSYAKDAFAARRFAAPDLPIPRVLAHGRRGDDHFAVSERAAGRPMSALDSDTQRALVPCLLETLDAIGRVDLAGTSGFGDWDAAGIGGDPTWHAFLVRVTQNDPDGFYRDWHALFRTSFLERAVYDAIARRMLALLPRCPEIRALVHHDLHDDNVLSDGHGITAVVDWGNAIYGDPLYDVAWFDAWYAWWHGGATFLDERYGGQPGYRERVACYRLRIGLDDLRFFARMGRREDYERMRARLLAQIAEPAPD